MAKKLSEGRKVGSGRKPGTAKTLAEGRKVGSGRKKGSVSKTLADGRKVGSGRKKGSIKSNLLTPPKENENNLTEEELSKDDPATTMLLFGNNLQMGATSTDTQSQQLHQLAQTLPQPYQYQNFNLYSRSPLIMPTQNQQLNPLSYANNIQQLQQSHQVQQIHQIQQEQHHQTNQVNHNGNTLQHHKSSQVNQHHLHSSTPSPPLSSHNHYQHHLSHQTSSNDSHFDVNQSMKLNSISLGLEEVKPRHEILDNSILSYGSTRDTK